jgi:hypothetical protein
MHCPIRYHLIIQRAWNPFGFMGVDRQKFTALKMS